MIPTKQKINRLYEVIKEANEEIEKLRSECTHETYTVKLYSWRVGSFNPQRICNECDAVVTGITKEEELNCWREYEKFKQDCVDSLYEKNK